MDTYILDTHTLIWFLNDDSKLSSNARKLICENDVMVSIVAFWELAIKISIGKLRLNTALESVMQQTDIDQIRIIPIKRSHILTLIDLPFKHRDPFDRILIALAMTENIPIISADKKFDLYEIMRVW